MPLRSVPAIVVALAAVAAVPTAVAAGGAAQARELTTFYLLLLKRAPDAPRLPADEVARIQQAHIAHLEKLGVEGAGLAAGPFADRGEIRGINILKADSAEHARDLQAPDPAVRAGLLSIEVIPFLTAPGAFGKALTPFEPDHLYFGFLVNGPDRNHPPAEAARLQKEHLAYMTGEAEAGRLVLAGPVALEGSPRRGIVVYRAPTEAEARRLAEGDPMVKAGRLRVELHPWMTAKGVLR